MENQFRNVISEFIYFIEHNSSRPYGIILEYPNKFLNSLVFAFRDKEAIQIIDCPVIVHFVKIDKFLSIIRRSRPPHRFQYGESIKWKNNQIELNYENHSYLKFWFEKLFTRTHDPTSH